MSEKTGVKYRLFAVKPDEKGVKTACEYRFSRITDEYGLIYTDGDSPEEAIEVTQADAYRLKSSDEEWLQMCNVVILAEQAKAHEIEMAELLSDRIHELEEVLKQKKRQLEG